MSHIIFNQARYNDALTLRFQSSERIIWNKLEYAIVYLAVETLHNKEYGFLTRKAFGAITQQMHTSTLLTFDAST